MSEEREMEELERRLDAAFRATRPRRGFEDELWARLQARRPWWRRLGDRGRAVPWGRVAAGLVTVALVGLVVTLVRVGGSHGGAPSATTASSRATNQGPLAAPAAPGASRSGETAALPFGPLPAPAAAGVLQAVRSGGASPLPAGAQRVDAGAVSPPSVASSLAVYRFEPATGPASGTVLEPGQLPAGLPSGFYPSRPPAAAVAAAAAAGSGQPVALTQARLAYVAVVAGSQGYLEPVYVYTGTAGTGPAGVPVQLLVSALDPAALR